MKRETGKKIRNTETKWKRTKFETETNKFGYVCFISIVFVTAALHCCAYMILINMYDSFGEQFEQ